MILTVGSIKGGVGKSSIAVNVAVALSRTSKVLVIDGDAQGSAALFTEARAEAMGETGPGFACVRAREAEVRTQARSMRGDFDHIVIDVGGQDNRALRAALTLCDRVLIPVPPRSLDAWAVDAMLETVASAQDVNPDLRALAVINLAFPRGSDNDETFELLRDHEGLTVAPVPIVQRKAWSDAAGGGLGVLDPPRNAKAAAEFTALMEFLGLSGGAD